MAYRSDHSLFFIFLPERERVTSDRSWVRDQETLSSVEMYLGCETHVRHCSEMKLRYGGMGEAWLSLEGLQHPLRCKKRGCDGGSI